MYTGYLTPNQNKSYHYNSPSKKLSSPSIKHKLAYNTPSTQSTKDLSMKKEQFKLFKILPENFTPTNKKLGPSSPNKL